MFKKLIFIPLLIFPLFCFAQKPFKVKNSETVGTIMRYQNFPARSVERRTIDVWLPENYAASKKYAVLYMHDGQNLFSANDSETGTDWNIDETLQRLINENKTRETIVVGIWNTAKRAIEFSPQKAFDIANHKNVKKSQFIKARESLSDQYLKFIVNELKPFIDKNYSTKTDRENTVIMGSSMGGLMSLYAISEYPLIFGGAACLSTQFPLGDGVMIEYMKTKLPPPKTHKIYFDFGTETLDSEIEPFQKKADSQMKKKGYKQGKNWITRKFQGEEHSEKSWRKRVEIPLTFLLKK